jgi:5'-3' exonuclease
MTDILVDASNMFFRARHVVRGDDAETKVGMAYHIMFNSINKVWRDFNGRHVIFCFEGRSWRKSVSSDYKANRAAARAALTEKEAEEDKMFWEAFDQFKEFLTNKTNCTILRHEACEADDFIARWIQNHPDREHVIVSSDSDFFQLLAPNVRIYNGITKTTITLEGFFDDKGKTIIDKKTKQAKAAPDPQWLLFEKCMRGDSSDNVFSAYPGVREKGTKNKVGLREAFADRNDKGYNWNNLMLQRWTDHEGVEHRVRDRYEANRQLIDLTQQPDDIKLALDATINESINKEAKRQVGVEFLRFCGKWDLQDIAKRPDDHVAYLNSRYINVC